MLRGVQTVFLASTEVTPEEFANAYRNLGARREFPNLQALVLALKQRRADGDHYVTALYQPSEGNSTWSGSTWRRSRRTWPPCWHHATVTGP